MKKIILSIIIIISLAGIIFLLFRNRAANLAKAKSAEKISEFPVSTEHASMQKLSEKLSLVGTINAITEVSVLSETQGRIISLKVDVGSHLKTGDEIAKVDDEIKKAAYLNAEASYEKAKKDLERNEQLYKEKSISEAQLDAIRYAYKASESAYLISKRQLNDTRITSPISGVVSAKSVELGSVISINTPLVYIVDISSLKVKVNVSEKDVVKLKTGDQVTITTDVYNGKEVTGKIKSISDKADEAHTYPVEIVFQNNSKNPFRAGMFARVTFQSVEKEATLTIPRMALIGSIRQPEVYVVENGKAMLKKISIGDDAGKLLEVTQGLKDGDEVVINGQMNLKDGIAVKVIK
ncbi:MAG: HlyD protein [Ignavibacteria bacterium]|nr:HlyD protein [Ignavibacteria bacterium]